MHEYYIYILSNKNNNVIYIGVTNDLYNRVLQHKDGINKNCFTYKYACYKLVYFEEYNSINDAIAREKQLKNWKREWKDKLIEGVNSLWDDLFERECGVGL